jgi:hypothetical protein
MNDAVSIAQRLRLKLRGNDSQKLDQLTDALLDAAIAKNTTAMKIVVDLIEPPKAEEPKREPLTDEELLERLDQFADRIAARRDQPQTRS